MDRCIKEIKLDLASTQQRAYLRIGQCGDGTKPRLFQRSFTLGFHHSAITDEYHLVDFELLP